MGCATTAGLFVTDDSLAEKATWRPVLTQTQVHDLEVRPGDPDWLYAAITSFNTWRLVYSNDRGATWNDVPGPWTLAGAHRLA